MPSGTAHKALTVATSPLAILGAWTAFGFPALDLQAWGRIGIFAVGYLANPILLSPDMDLPESVSSNWWKGLESIWWPYQALIHRGPLSHWPPLSSLLRMGYLWAMTFVVFCLCVGTVDLIWYGLFKEILFPMFLIWRCLSDWLLIWSCPWWWFFIAGIAISDLLHVISDVAYSYMKK